MTRILPADVYDAIEFVAEVEGGIGAGYFGEYADEPGVRGNCTQLCEGVDRPLCVVGAAMFLDGSHYDGAVITALRNAEIWDLVNDAAVNAVNNRLGSEHPDARVPFADWCAELGVERGA